MMTRRLLMATAVVALLVPGVPGPAQAEPDSQGLEALSWMAGSWRVAKGERSSEEHWTSPEGRLMVGMHRDVFGPDRSFFEYLRIEARDEAIVYVASPGGASPTEFRAVEISEGLAVFTNPEHDFPRQITYRLDEGKLCATAAGVRSNGERSVAEWCWERVGATR